MTMSNENKTSTGRDKRAKYRCQKCGAEFFITVKPTFCAVCGSNHIYVGSKKAAETIDRLTADINALIPEMERLYADFVKLYTEYEYKRETLRVYSYRGYMRKEDVPTFKRPALEAEFFKSRKRKPRSRDNENELSTKEEVTE